MRQVEPVRQDGSEATRPLRNGRNAVEDFVQQRILGGDWLAGHKLPSEAELGRQFDASRTVVREALRRLQGRGLVVTVNGSGSYVGRGQLSDVSLALNAYSVLSVGQKAFGDLLDLRMASEGDAAAMVAAGIDHLDWRRLEARFEMMRACRVIEEFAILDIDFHLDVLRLSGNELFASLGAALRDRYVRFAIDSYRNSDQLRSETLNEHRTILDAIAGGDVDGARRAAREHVARARGRWEIAHPHPDSSAPELHRPPASSGVGAQATSLQASLAPRTQ